jgi:transcriptional regulator with XRE-family HTH domain
MIKPVATFAERLEQALIMRNMRPADLARKTGLKESTISQYRSSYAVPRKERTLKIAQVLGVSPSWLMGLDVNIDDTPKELTEKELEIIKRYRQADIETQRLVEYLLKI